MHIRPIKFGSLVAILLLFCSSLWGQNPPAYEASWHAGMFGLSQNPAAIAAASSRGEFILGSLNLSAQNSLFETNEIRQFFPTRLLGNLGKGPDSLSFLTDPSWNGFSPVGEDVWNASIRNQFQLLGGFWRLETSPDWVERGLARRVFSLRLEREELFQFNDVDNSLARAYAQQFDAGALQGLVVEDDYFQIRAQAWDALAANFAISFGRGKNLLHLGMGAKLLSAGAYMDFRAYGNRLEFQGNDQLSLRSDSVVFTYNPSFERALGQNWDYPSIQRRYNNFENAWGIAGEIGLIYQIFNYNREPVAEVGAAVQNIGLIQFWNLSQTQYSAINTQAAYSLFEASQANVNQVHTVLQTLAEDSVQLGQGITQRLPLILTTHGRIKLGKKGWGMHFRGNFTRLTVDAPWETLVRATLFYERRRQAQDTKGKKKGRWGLFVPVSTNLVLPTPSTLVLRPRVGLFLSFNKRWIIGSNDLLTTMFYSGIREGVAATHLFIGAHFPLSPNYE